MQKTEGLRNSKTLSDARPKTGLIFI